MTATDRRAKLYTWQGIDAARLESARVSFAPDGRVRASTRIVASPGAEGGPYQASFELSVTADGVVDRLSVRSATDEYERQLSLNRSEDGFWLVDDGTGVRRDKFDGALDVDVRGAALTNALPIRRLNLHRTPGELEVAAVYVYLPDLSIKLVHQRYETISAIDGDAGNDRAVIRYTSESFDGDLVVDDNGIVVEYPGFATRL